MTILRTILLLVFFALTNPLSAQTKICNCADNLEASIRKTEENYAGFPTKAAKQNSGKYQALVKTLKVRAAKESDPKKCFFILRDYVRFFKDKHFIISYDSQKDFDSIIVSQSLINEEYFKGHKNLKPVEGIWVNPEKTTKIAIRKAADGTFQAFKISSASDNFPVGFVYFTLTAKADQYIVKRYNAFLSTDLPAKKTGNLLRIWNQEIWGKVSPGQLSPAENAELATWIGYNKGLDFKNIRPDVGLLKIPTFYNNDSRIEKLVKESDAAIRKNKYLIIDLRSNGGGNSGWINFLPYMMTNPITQPMSMLRITPDNVKAKMPELDAFVLNPISADYKKYFPDNILALFKAAHKELPTTKAEFYPMPAAFLPLDSVTRYPEKVALIVDNFGGSSTEFFLYLSRQSKKTTSYGQNTIGMMDYEGMSVPTPLPFKQFIFTIPNAKSAWTDSKPIDLTGFSPDIPLKQPYDQWVDIVVKDLLSK